MVTQICSHTELLLIMRRSWYLPLDTTYRGTHPWYLYAINSTLFTITIFVRLCWQRAEPACRTVGRFNVDIDAVIWWLEKVLGSKGLQISISIPGLDIMFERTLRSKNVLCVYAARSRPVIGQAVDTCQSQACCWLRTHTTHLLMSMWTLIISKRILKVL